MRVFLRPLGVALLFSLAACASVPVSSIVPLMQVDMATTDAEQLRIALQLPDGLLSRPGGVALELATDTWFIQVREEMLDRMAVVGDKDRAVLLTEEFGFYNREKENADTLLDIAGSYVRDLALAVSGARETLLINADRRDEILDLAHRNRYDIAQLDRAGAAVQHARRCLALNTNFETTICSLLLQLRKELTHA